MFIYQYIYKCIILFLIIYSCTRYCMTKVMHLALRILQCCYREYYKVLSIQGTIKMIYFYHSDNLKSVWNLSVELIISSNKAYFPNGIGKIFSVPLQQLDGAILQQILSTTVV